MSVSYTHLDVYKRQDIHRTLYNVCGYSISALHLKSLDTCINNNELNTLTSADPHFHTGWLYDNVINVFLNKICNKFPIFPVGSPVDNPTKLILTFPLDYYAGITEQCEIVNSYYNNNNKMKIIKSEVCYKNIRLTYDDGG